MRCMVARSQAWSRPFPAPLRQAAMTAGRVGAPHSRCAANCGSERGLHVAGREIAAGRAGLRHTHAERAIGTLVDTRGRVVDEKASLALAGYECQPGPTTYQERSFRAHLPVRLHEPRGQA